MTTVREYLKDKELWQEIKDKGDYPFITDNTDTLFLVRYGSSTLHSSFEEVDISTLASIVHNLYDKRWQSLIEASFPDLSSNTEKQITETVEDDRETTSDRNSDNKVSAYNDDSLVTESGEEATSSETVDGTKTRDHTEKQRSMEAIFNNLTWEKQVNTLEVAMRDVANLIRLDIYDTESEDEN